MDNQKEELLLILKDITSSDFFTKKEKEEVQYLALKGNKPIDELIKILKKYFVAKVASGLNTHTSD